MAIPRIEEQRLTRRGAAEGASTASRYGELKSKFLSAHLLTRFPKYVAQCARFERRDAARFASFTKRYEVWLATYSLIFYKDRKHFAGGPTRHGGCGAGGAETSARRSRMATIAALFAAREIDLGVAGDVGGSA